MMRCRKNSSDNKRISNKIFSDTHNSISHNDRTLLYNTLKNNKNIIFCPERKSFSEITKIYNKYSFVLSPRGNGLDTHRIWELFLAGVIVITKTSSLDGMFIKNNLPVVIIKDWDELNDNLLDKLSNWYKKHFEKTSVENIYPKLLFSYWIK